MALPVSFNINLKDKFSAVSNKVGASVDRLNKKLRKTDKLTDKAEQSMMRFRRAAKFGVGAAAAAATAGIAATLTVGAKFEDAMADLSAITGAAGEDLDFFGGEARELAKQFGSSAPEVVKSMKNIASAKSELLKTPSGLVEVTKQAIILEKATGEPLESMANSLTLALNQFNATADESKRFANVLAAGAKIGASEIGFTANAVRESGVAARLAGVDFEQFNAAIQVVAKGGIKGSRAGTQLKIVFSKLEKQFKVSEKGLGPVLDALAKKNLTVAELTKLFGEEAFQTAKILIDNRATVKNWTSALTGTNIAQEQANIRMATFSARMARIKSRIQDALIKTFNKLSPTIEDLTNKFAGWLDSLNEDDINKFTTSLQNLVQALSSLVQGFVKVIGMLNKLDTRFDTILNPSELGRRTGGAIRGLFASKPEEERTIEQKTTEINAIAKQVLQGAVDTTLTIKADQGINVSDVNSKSAGLARPAGINLPQPLPGPMFSGA